MNRICRKLVLAAAALALLGAAGMAPATQRWSKKHPQHVQAKGRMTQPARKADARTKAALQRFSKLPVKLYKKKPKSPAHSPYP